jgi:hypothetical protein
MRLPSSNISSPTSTSTISRKLPSNPSDALADHATSAPTSCSRRARQPELAPDCFAE